MNCKTRQPALTGSDQRVIDRRTMSWMTLYGTLFINRRQESRRTGEQLNSYIDRYGFLPLGCTLTVILLCFADAFLTSVLISHGAVEMNVLMDWLIQYDLYTFAVVKMSMTGIALLILVMHYNFAVSRLIRVRHVLLGLVPLYSLLLYHELNMLASI